MTPMLMAAAAPTVHEVDVDDVSPRTHTRSGSRRIHPGAVEPR